MEADAEAQCDGTLCRGYVAYRQRRFDPPSAGIVVSPAFAAARFALWGARTPLILPLAPPHAAPAALSPCREE